MTTTPKPTPVATESRTCFGIEWYATEEEADRRGLAVRDRGDTYNGGMFHGMRCGRDRGFDRVVDGQPQYAVTTA